MHFVTHQRIVWRYMLDNAEKEERREENKNKIKNIE